MNFFFSMFILRISYQLRQVEFVKKSLNHKVMQSLASSSVICVGNYMKQMLGVEITGVLLF